MNTNQNLKQQNLSKNPYLRNIASMLLSIFFNRKFLKGRWFNEHSSGYLWAFKSIWQRNFLRLEPPAPWPLSLTCKISNFKNITFHPDDLNNFQSPGTYFQNFSGHISIGRGSYIAPNVGIITANHNLNNLNEHEESKDVRIGEKCWIGMNSVILPGVELGDSTIVAAGSIVTKSFLQGGIVIGGSPAKLIKEIN
ncbi:Maltose O-acetyltransferase [compost metagenome]|jgi:hypothetical protein